MWQLYSYEFSEDKKYQSVLQIIFSEVATKEFQYWQLESLVADTGCRPANGMEGITPGI